MSKVFAVALAVLVVVISTAAVVFAMPLHRRVGGTGGDIAMIECQDHECKIGCRTLHKMPTDQCTTVPFRHGESMKTLCSAAPATGLCYTMGIFAKNGTDGNYCTDANMKFGMYHQCNVCRESHYKKGSYEITTGCDSPTTMQMAFECDSSCQNCQKTHSVTDKQCAVPTGFPDAIQFSAPARCEKTISYFHYNNSDCSGSGATSPMTEYSNVCYSMMGRSHMYVCS